MKLTLLYILPLIAIVICLTTTVFGGYPNSLLRSSRNRRRRWLNKRLIARWAVFSLLAATVITLIWPAPGLPDTLQGSAIAGCIFFPILIYMLFAKLWRSITRNEESEHKAKQSEPEKPKPEADISDFSGYPSDSLIATPEPVGPRVDLTAAGLAASSAAAVALAAKTNGQSSFPSEAQAVAGAQPASNLASANVATAHSSVSAAPTHISSSDPVAAAAADLEAMRAANSAARLNPKVESVTAVAPTPAAVAPTPAVAAPAVANIPVSAPAAQTAVASAPSPTTPDPSVTPQAASIAPAPKAMPVSAPAAMSADVATASLAPEQSVTQAVNSATDLSTAPEADLTPKHHASATTDTAAHLDATSATTSTPDLNTTPAAEITPELNLTPAAEALKELNSTPVAESTTELNSSPAAESTPEHDTTPAPDATPDNDSKPVTGSTADLGAAPATEPTEDLDSTIVVDSPSDLDSTVAADSTLDLDSTLAADSTLDFDAILADDATLDPDSTVAVHLNNFDTVHDYHDVGVDNETTQGDSDNPATPAPATTPHTATETAIALAKSSFASQLEEKRLASKQHLATPDKEKLMQLVGTLKSDKLKLQKLVIAQQAAINSERQSHSKTRKVATDAIRIMRDARQGQNIAEKIARRERAERLRVQGDYTKVKRALNNAMSSLHAQKVKENSETTT